MRKAVLNKIHVVEVKLIGWKPIQDLTVDLDYEKERNRMLNDLMQAFGRDRETSSKRYFLLRWSGTPSPEGAVVDGQVVGSWMPGNILYAKTGEALGTFDWLIKGDDDERSEYEMLVMTPMSVVKNLDDFLRDLRSPSSIVP